MESEARENTRYESETIQRYRKSLSSLYKDKRERIDELGQRAFSPAYSESQQSQARIELMNLLWLPLTPSTKEGRETGAVPQSREDEEVLLGGLAQFYINRLDAYDPNTSFYTFLLQSAPYAVLDNVRRESGSRPLPDWAVEEKLKQEGKTEAEIRQELETIRKKRTKKYGNLTISSDAPASSEEPEGATLGDVLPGGLSPEKELIDDSAEETIARMLAALLNVRKLLHGKENNPARINFFRLFYTDTVVYTLREVSGLWRDYLRHEREILRQLKPLFLGFTLRLDFPEPPLDECFMPLTDDYCSLSAVAAAPARLESEVLPDGKDVHLKEPFKDEVLASYLKRKEQRSASRELVSQNRGKFLDYLRRCGVGRNTVL